MKTNGLLSLALLTFGCAALATAQDVAPLAKHLLKLSGRGDNPRGVCVTPEGGALAFHLARASEFVVVAEEPTATAMQATCARADAAGLLGRRLYVAESPSIRIVTADRYANLIVYASLTDELLSELDPVYLVGKLAPHGGRLVAGLAAGQTGGLTQAQLETWAKASSVSAARVVKDDFGLWAIIERPPLPGGVEWTHNNFDASNNPYTPDAAFAWPPMTQWMGKPYQKAGAVGIIGGGMLFAVTEEKTAVTDGRKVQTQSGRMGYPNVDSGVLFARDLYNGEILWTRTMSQGGKYSPDGFTSAYVYHAGELFVIDGPTARVLVLDALSGTEKRCFELSSLGPQVKWIAMSEGTLLALAGKLDDRAPVGSIYRYSAPFNAGGSGFEPDTLGFGRTIGAVDPATGKVRWRHDENTDAIHEYHICARDGRVFFLVEGKRIAGLDLKSGEAIWSNATSARLPEKRKGTYWLSGQVVSGGLIAGTDALVAVTAYGRGLYDYITFAVDPRDGHELWRKNGRAVGVEARENPAEAAFSRFFMREGLIIGTRFGATDARTGAPAAENPWPGVRKNGLCGYFTGSANVLCGQVGIAYDFANKRQIREYIRRKSHCAFGPRVGEGVYFSMPHECSCGYNLTRGWGADVSAGAFDVLAVPNAAGRRRYRADATPLSVRDADGDWAAYRGSTARANASSAAVLAGRADPERRWTWEPASPLPVTARDSMTSKTDYEAAQPIATGSLIVSAGPDGAMRAFDCADGNVKWTAFTGGRITISPTAWSGRIYVGSSDGYAYCFDAESGREIWRFRAAPDERRVLLFGHLSSTWPVTTGVLIHDGTAYFAAGLYGYNGGWLYAVDATTGALRWGTACGALDASDRTGFSIGGALTVARGHVWMRNHGFRLVDGVLDEPLEKEDIRYLRCTGMYGNDFLMTGGGNLTAEQHEQPRAKESNSIGQQGMTFYPLNATGVAATHTGKRLQPAAIRLFAQAWLLPSWDAQLTLLAPNQGKMSGPIEKRRATTLVACSTPLFEQFLKGNPATISGFKEVRGRPRNLPQLAGEQWRLERYRWYAFAPAPDAVVGVYATADVEESPAYHVGWFARDTGLELATVELPSEPRVDGMCVAADGTVAVQLLDGGLVAAR